MEAKYNRVPSATSSSSKSNQSDCKVKVVVRIRPQLPTEAGQSVTSVESNSAVLLRNPKLKSSEATRYKFDACYDSNAPQERLFTEEIEPLIENVINGINTTIFAYGVTGAGKTHTMQGTTEDPGIIPRALEKLLKLVHQREKQLHKSKTPQTPFEITISYLEIYNEKVYDLLVPQPEKEDLPVREDQNKNIFIANLTSMPITTFEDFQKTYVTGCKNRSVAATKLNSKSSRSHAILLVRVQMKDQETKKKITGKLHLIDLAGSEDNRKTDNAGDRMVESSSINQSLFELGNVVNALNKGLARVPYRNSKLTRLLQDSLGGNSVSVMIANISPAAQYFYDTYKTLNFASKSKNIVNRPVVNAEEPPEMQVIDAVQSEDKVGSKRRSEKELLNEKMKLMKVSADKENLENHVRKEVEKYLAPIRQKMELMSPSLRKFKVLGEGVQYRLENLEKKLVQQTEESIFQEIPVEVDSDDEICAPKQLTGIETPHTTAKTLKENVVLAKNLEENGKVREALTIYQQILPVMKNLKYTNQISKVEKRIRVLQMKLKGIKTEASDNTSGISAVKFSLSEDKDSEDEWAPPTRQNRNSNESNRYSSSSNTSSDDIIDSTSNTQKLLTLLNTLSVKELSSKLEKIGQKRARLIATMREVKPFAQVEDIKAIGFSDKQLSKFLIANQGYMV